MCLQQKIFSFWSVCFFFSGWIWGTPPRWIRSTKSLKSSWPLGESFWAKRIGFLKGSEMDFGRNRTKNPSFVFFSYWKYQWKTTNNKQIEPTKKQQTGPNNEKQHLFGATALCRLSASTASRGGELLGSIDDVPPFSRAKWALDFGGKKISQKPAK